MEGPPLGPCTVFPFISLIALSRSYAENNIYHNEIMKLNIQKFAKCNHESEYLVGI